MPSLAYPFKDNITYEKQNSNFFSAMLKKTAKLIKDIKTGNQAD
jgi:hypothetical protein